MVVLSLWLIGPSFIEGQVVGASTCTYTCSSCVMAGLIHAHIINTYVYTIVASAGAFSEASIHTHTYAHNDVSCLLCELLYVRIYTRAVLCMFMFMLLH